MKCEHVPTTLELTQLKDLELHNESTMLDADFEYGLPVYEMASDCPQRGYPSIYEVPGTDFDIASVDRCSQAGTQGIGSSLITVTTVGPHNFEAGQPFTITGFNNAVTGASRVPGSFVVNTIISSTQFTYYAKAKVASRKSTNTYNKYTIKRR